jgi:TPP-dependent pyruvate/acetoin dehydrogenase alpha subunit
MRAYLERRGLWDTEAERTAIADSLARVDGAVAEAESRPIPSLDAYIQAAS